MCKGLLHIPCSRKSSDRSHIATSNMFLSNRFAPEPQPLPFTHSLYSVLALHVKFDSFLLYGSWGIRGYILHFTSEVRRHSTGSSAASRASSSHSSIVIAIPISGSIRRLFSARNSANSIRDTSARRRLRESGAGFRAVRLLARRPACRLHRPPSLLYTIAKLRQR